ncbi:TRAP transporter small permease [Xanthobacter sp. YC-JY1]|uniref:TRAP transporter small permease n=1 Tax=Xanthobacter sp. YC-JY1 TaxID=2419844 RepID=UPI001F3D6DE8|nr:TRAP transporter small permease [Xanthobacter sp. YC-JY1]UJX46306.1 TRAP transporter small permease [Xanthobacter sp. YC-JY1]
MRGTWRAIDRGLDQLESAILIIIMIALFSLVVLQIGSRFMGDPLPWTEEISRYLMVWLMFFGAAVCVRHNEHIGFVLLAESTPAPVRTLLRLVARVGTLVFMLVIFWLSAEWVAGLVASEQTAITFPMSIYWVGLALPVASALGALYAAGNVVDRSNEASQLPPAAE